MIRIAFLISLGLLFSGCFTKQMPSIQTYSLNYDANVQSVKTIAKSLKVYEPKMFNYLNNSGIVYVENQIEYQHYALNKWSERPSKMIQNLIVQHLNNIQAFSFVATNNIEVHTDLKLISEIDDFTQYFKDDSSFVKLQIRVYLSNQNNQTVFKYFTYEQPCPTNDAKGAVIALNSAVNTFAQDLFTWLNNNTL